jgi:hypothetical protein
MEAAPGDIILVDRYEGGADRIIPLRTIAAADVARAGG